MIVYAECCGWFRTTDLRLGERSDTFDFYLGWACLFCEKPYDEFLFVGGEVVAQEALFE